MKTSKVLIVRGLLLCLFSYSLLTKLLQPSQFRYILQSQPFSKGLLHFLFWAIPAIETGCLLLLIRKDGKGGLWMVGLFSLCYAIYAAAILLGQFAFVPCACFGFFSGMSWSLQLPASLLVTLIASLGIFDLQVRAKRAAT